MPSASTTRFKCAYKHQVRIEYSKCLLDAKRQKRISQKLFGLLRKPRWSLLRSLNFQIDSDVRADLADSRECLSFLL
ncbi:hypothetical protein ASPCAL10067 [Aspergillus calidoustus]|uniref:Uncharacterized protein n=1 Tax=Aspergillus calidoustus TaxID=454130 RepID=A0A0U5G4B8_ASPCI|nr:hypothetical protein ASPCAL10067 [Aspergillus calidoustus]